MNEIGMIFVYLGFAFFAVFITAESISIFFPPVNVKRNFYIALIPYIAFQIYANFHMGENPLWVFFLNILLIFCLTLQRKSRMKRCIFFAIYMSMIWALPEAIVWLLLRNISFSELATNIIGSTMTKMLMLVFVILSKRFYKGYTGGTHTIPNRYWIVLLLIPLGSFYIMMNMLLLAVSNPEHNFLASIVVIILLFINVILFGLYDQFSQYTEAMKRNLIYEQQLELCTQNAIEREVKNKEIRKLRHNMKEHLVSLHGMAIKGDLSGITQYIDELIPQSVQYGSNDISRTGNVVVDSLVNYKCTIAKNEGISVRAKVFVPVNLPFQTGNISIILGNLLENALEACREVKEKDRFMEVNLSFQKGMFLISVKNSFIGYRKQNNDGTYRTTKGDSINHGLGLSSVMDAVKQYGGELTTTMNENVFGVTAVLFGSE